MDFTDTSTWLPVEEVAKRLGLGPDRVRRLIRERKIRAYKIGKWLIHPEDLTRFIVSRTNIPEIDLAAGDAA